MAPSPGWPRLLPWQPFLLMLRVLRCGETMNIPAGCSPQLGRSARPGAIHPCMPHPIPPFRVGWMPGAIVETAKFADIGEGGPEDDCVMRADAMLGAVVTVTLACMPCAPAVLCCIPMNEAICGSLMAAMHTTMHAHCRRQEPVRSRGPEVTQHLRHQNAPLETVMKGQLRSQQRALSSLDSQVHSSARAAPRPSSHALPRPILPPPTTGTAAQHVAHLHAASPVPTTVAFTVRRGSSGAMPSARHASDSSGSAATVPRHAYAVVPSSTAGTALPSRVEAPAADVRSAVHELLQALDDSQRGVAARPATGCGSAPPVEVPLHSADCPCSATGAAADQILAQQVDMRNMMNEMMTMLAVDRGCGPTAAGAADAKSDMAQAGLGVKHQQRMLGTSSGAQGRRFLSVTDLQPPEGSMGGWDDSTSVPAAPQPARLQDRPPVQPRNQRAARAVSLKGPQARRAGGRGLGARVAGRGGAARAAETGATAARVLELQIAQETKENMRPGVHPCAALSACRVPNDPLCSCAGTCGMHQLR
jgi:hypothetical protein